MYAITGSTGQVGRALVRALLKDGRPIRAVVRDTSRAPAGCEVAAADMTDADALTAAFTGVEAVFILLPPVFDPSPDFAESRAVINAVETALLAARPERVVMLSTIGAQARKTNLLSQLGLMEAALRDLPLRVTLLRAAWFIENAAWDVGAAQTGVISSFLQPLDQPFPMVSVADVAETAARLLQDPNAPAIVELEGPQRASPNDIASSFARLMHRPVHAEAVARDTWEALFRAQGMRNPEPRMHMLDGFNAGWIEFEDAPHARKGRVRLDDAVARLVDPILTPKQA